MTEKQGIDERYSLSKEGLACTLDITIAGNEIGAGFQKKLKELSVRYRKPGFRPGKFPIKALQAEHGDSILYEVAGEKADETFKQVLEKEALTMAAEPKVDMGKLKLGDDVTIRAEFECMPEITIVDLKKGSVKKPVVSVEKKDIDQEIDNILERQQDWKEKKTKSSKGDQVTISYTGTIDGVAFEGGSAENSDIIAGDGKMLPEFDKALIGEKAGAKKEIEVTFPKDYAQQDLAGKKAVFAIEFHAVKAPKKAKLDKDLFEKIGSKAEKEEDFRSEVEDKLNKENEHLAKQIAHKRILEQLKKTYEFELPSAIVAQEKAAIKSGKPESSEEDITKEAEENIKISLVLQKYAKEMNISVNDHMTREYLKTIAPDFIPVEMFINWYQQDKQRWTKVQVAVIEQEVVAKLLLQCAEKEDKLTLSKAKQILEIKE